MKIALENVLKKNRPHFRSVVDFDPAKEKSIKLDLTATNAQLTATDSLTTENLSLYINNELEKASATFGIGGYNEERIIYNRSILFNDIALQKAFSPVGGEDLAGAARTIHLGLDIWGAIGTNVYVPVGGVVHSFANNNNFGDYGATIILQHQLDTILFYTLYGHLSLNDLTNLQEGKYISRGEILGHFGNAQENGDWPPHLHFQIINDIRLHKGDYPGVCTLAEREKYLNNCPDPDLIAGLMQYAI
jgi:murein DD-endopeptidase MepM/ murein hydrolase activator NlpD